MSELFEKIGFTHLGCTVDDPKNKEDIKLYFTVCKKTQKVCLINIPTTIPFHMIPLMIHDTHISNNTCLDGGYCLNTNCKYNTSPSFKDSVKSSMRVFCNTEENTEYAVLFAKNNIEWVNNRLTEDMFKDSTSSEVYPDYMKISSVGVKSE